MITGRYNLTLVSKIFNSWLVCLFILVVSSYLPHWHMYLSSWVNLGLYALAFIITLFVLVKDRYSLYTFTPFLVLFAICYLAIIPIFFGDNFLFGNNAISMLLYKYIFLSGIFTFNFAILNYASQLALHPKRPWILLIASFAFNAGVFWYHFHDLLPFSVANIFNTELYLKSLTYFLLPVVALFSYGLLNPYFKSRYGEYSHSIMTILALMSIRELASAISELKHVLLFGLDQIFLTIALILLNFFLFKKVNFVYSTTGAIYNQILHHDLDIGNMSLETRDKRGFRIFASFVYYFNQRKNIILPALLVLAVIFRYTDPPVIVSLNILTFALVTFFVVFYFIVIYNRKTVNNEFILRNRSTK